MPHTTQNSQQAGYIETHKPTPASMASTHEPSPDPAHIKGVDEDATKETPLSNEAQEFAKVLGLIAKSSAKAAKPKLREPDTFNGSDS